ncbi:hypothetical protein [Candidatus Pelagibacter sp. HIMB1715]|uniref:hypothetical protein n=1 Tax=Candidatus Pelagibacter sp. HIMB1715 TaxID=3413369 RepID=UPI003F87F265
MYKKIYILILIIFLNQCGFSPIYTNKSFVNFQITNISFEGDREINNFLKSRLYQFKNNDNEKKFQIKTNTEFNKNTISKDKTAKITEYEISAIVIFEISANNNLVKKLTLSERKNMNNIDDKFEEQKQERITKQNFANIFSQKLLAELSILNVN